MMELVLNLSWLLLAVACYHFWWPRQRRAGAGKPRCFRGLLALGCALVVLFPIISVTDDLHEEQAVMEDSSARLTKRWAGNHGSACAGQHFLTPPSRVFSRLPLVADLAHVIGSLWEPESSSPLEDHLSPVFGRAPPLSRL